MIKIKIKFKTSNEKEEFTLETLGDKGTFEALKTAVVAMCSQQKYKDFTDYAQSEILDKSNNNRE